MRGRGEKGGPVAQGMEVSLSLKKKNKKQQPKTTKTADNLSN